MRRPLSSRALSVARQPPARTAMALPRISSKLPPDIDPTKAPVAFGRRGLPKLNEQLQEPDLLTRQRALMALCDLAHDPENAYEAIAQGFLDNLKTLLLDEDGTVRQKTTEVLYIMATHSIGRTNFIEHGVIPALAQLLDDPVDLCRWNMHYALKLVAETHTGGKKFAQFCQVPGHLCVPEVNKAPSRIALQVALSEKLLDPS